MMCLEFPEFNYDMLTRMHLLPMAADLKFFQKYSWIPAVRAAVDASAAMRLGTYSKDGKVLSSAWTFTGWTNRGSETLTNGGLGNPTRSNGMIRTAFRPWDDACIYQLLVPANMMYAKYLEEASLIMTSLSGEEAKNLTSTMRDLARTCLGITQSSSTCNFPSVKSWSCMAVHLGR